MDKLLKPSKLDVDPYSPDAGLVFKHWFSTFQRFRTAARAAQSENEKDNFDSYGLLVNYLAPAILPYIKETENYDTAIETLKQTFVKPKNVMFARHILATRTQKSGENLSEFLQALSKDCQFQAVTAENYKKEMVRDAFINELASTTIRQRLLEVAEPTLDRAFDLALSLNQAQEQSLKYTTSPTSAATVPQSSCAAMEPILNEDLPISSSSFTFRKQNSTRKCFFCRESAHPRSQCIAKDADCYKFGKKDILQGSAKPKKPTLPRLSVIKRTLPFFNTIKGAALLVGLSYRHFHKWP